MHSTSTMSYMTRHSVRVTVYRARGSLLLVVYPGVIWWLYLQPTRGEDFIWLCDTLMFTPVCLTPTSLRAHRCYSPRRFIIPCSFVSPRVALQGRCACEMNVGAALLPGCEAILCFINIILQLVSLPPSHWGTFQGLTEFGEHSHRPPSSLSVGALHSKKHFLARFFDGPKNSFSS